METDPPTRIRIVLAGMPRLMAELIDNMLSSHPDVQVVARNSEDDRLRTFVRRHSADVLIIGEPDDTGAEVAPAEMFSWCPMRVISVRDCGKTGMLWVMRPDGVPIGELSAKSLLRAATASGAL
jgi:chemotaxis response regulator CheB